MVPLLVLMLVTGTEVNRVDRVETRSGVVYSISRSMELTHTEVVTKAGGAGNVETGKLANVKAAEVVPLRSSHFRHDSIV